MKTLTPYQRAEIWGQIESKSLALYQSGACKQNLIELQNNLDDLIDLSKKLKRDLAAKAIIKANENLSKKQK